MKNTKGITLIEIMLIIMLMVLCFSVVFSILFHHKKVIGQKEQKDLLILENSLKLYRLDNGFYPSTKQGLNALIKKPISKPIPLHWVPYLSYLPVDSWGQAYHYKNIDNQAKVFSCGPSIEQQDWWYRITHYFSEDKECS